MTPLLRRWPLAILAVVVLAFSPTTGPAGAQEQSKETLLAQGRAAFAAGEYLAAADAFHAAALIDPMVPGPAYLEGLALNRAGRFDRALIAFALADRLGITTPRLDLEIGWAAVGTGAWDLAIQRLRRYERRSPGEGRTLDLLGRAYLGAGYPDLALATFREALARDPSLAPSVEYHMARVALVREGETAAAEALQRYTQEHPDSAVARSLATLAPELAAPKAWAAYVSLSGGYNSNVIGLPDRLALPPDISDEESAVFSTELGGRYTFDLDPFSALTFGYGNVNNYYFDLEDFSLSQHFLYASYGRRLNQDIGVALRAYGDYVLIGGDSFRLQAGVRPSIAYRLGADAAIELSYLAAFSDYKFDPVIRAQERDGDYHAIMLQEQFGLPGTKLRLQVGGGYVETDADGSDFDYHGTTVFGSAAYPFDVPLGDATWVVVGQVGYSYSLDHYDHNNSLSGATGFAFEREDDVHRVNVNLLVPIRPRIEAFAAYNFVDTGSNIVFYDYDQHVGRAGLNVRF